MLLLIPRFFGTEECVLIHAHFYFATPADVIVPVVRPQTSR